MIWAIIIVLWWNVLGAYVVHLAIKNGHLPPLTLATWLFACVSWPWLVYRIRKIERELDRMRPFEEWAERYDQEEIDKRLDDLKDD